MYGFQIDKTNEFAKIEYHIEIMGTGYRQTGRVQVEMRGAVEADIEQRYDLWKESEAALFKQVIDYLANGTLSIITKQEKSGELLREAEQGMLSENNKKAASWSAFHKLFMRMKDEGGYTLWYVLAPSVTTTGKIVKAGKSLSEQFDRYIKKFNK